LGNPVWVWWSLLSAISLLNISLWIWTYGRLKTNKNAPIRQIQYLLRLSAVYVFVCAFRSVFPRADVQKICLFDTWLSSVFVGRSVATVAELSFVAEWAIVIYLLAKQATSNVAMILAKLIVPMIFVAEIFSWYATVTTNFLGNACEESIWAITFSMIFISLVLLFVKMKGAFRQILGLFIFGTLAYVAFMILRDVPMYLSRWQAQLHDGHTFFGFSAGVHELLTVWVPTDRFDQWKDEIPWMSLYFSFAVWTSIAFCYAPGIISWYDKRHEP
jgi:hypothetical protein